MRHGFQAGPCLVFLKLTFANYLFSIYLVGSGVNKLILYEKCFNLYIQSYVLNVPSISYIFLTFNLEIISNLKLQEKESYRECLDSLYPGSPILNF